MGDAASFWGMFDYITDGRSFDIVRKDIEELTGKFPETDYKFYDADEQLVFEGETLYICVY